jgi:methylated-DNA-[protein]-cysteine S-methyltransferase
MFYASYETPIRMIHLYADGSHLIGVFFEQQNKFKNSIQTNHIIQKTVIQLDEYFAKQRTTFDIPLKITGTKFQEKVWGALLKIPFGEKKSYIELAGMISHPNAARAVGSANRKNIFPILIPCHRIVKANGEIGGYAGGVDFKNYLLNLEKKAP